MKYSYSGPTLRLNYWCVTKKDLERFSDFLHSKFKTEKIEMRLETVSRRNKIYQTFTEFEEDIETVLSWNDEIHSLEIERSHLKANSRQSIWMEINFQFKLASFNLYAEDENGSLKGWVQTTYDELQELVNSFRPAPEFEEILKRDFQVRYPERRLTNRGVIVFDYDGNISARIKEELMLGQKRNGRLPELNTEWYKDKKLLLILAVLFILLLANIIRSFFP